MAEQVDFFIIGVQKGGTSALWLYLQQHPELQLARVKEVHHFDNDKLDWSAPSHNELHDQFDWSVKGVLRGEATPIYIYWPAALPRLKSYNPSAKLIVALRQPSFRAFSGWRTSIKAKGDDWSFEEAISDKGRERVKQAPGGVHRFYSYVERSFYAGQIDRLLGLFPRQQIHFLRTDSLWQNLGNSLSAIETFLGVENKLALLSRRQYIVPYDGSDLGKLPRGTRLPLDDLFREDIHRTADLTGLDLSDWLKPNYTEPMRGHSAIRRTLARWGAHFSKLKSDQAMA